MHSLSRWNVLGLLVATLMVGAGCHVQVGNGKENSHGVSALGEADPMGAAFTLFQQMAQSGLITDEDHEQLKNLAVAFIQDTANTAGGVPMDVGRNFLHTARRLQENLRKYRRLHTAGTIDKDVHRKLHNIAIHRFTRNWV